MAANANPNLSTVAEKSEEAAPSLPVVRVLPTQDGKSVEVKFDEYDATTAPLDRVYTNEPYNFRAINAGGREPRVKTFGSLFACNGGTLIIGENQYRIQVIEQQQQPQQQDELIRGIQNMSLALHGIQETLPSVIVGHVVTPSTASRNRQVSTRILDAVGLSPFPDTDEEVYTLPAELQQTSAWNFSFKWPSISNDDKVLERTSYEPVLNFLLRLGLYAEDVSEGQNCIDKLLYNSDIYTPRKENPLEVRGQRVFHCHRVQGRTDLVVLRTKRHGGPIIRNMVEFAIEIKTVASLQQSKDGCLLEAQLQLIGLNAFNTLKSPPIVLSNLTKTHHVVYLDYNQDGWSYVIKRKKCSTFAAAIHFAIKVAKERSISSNFSRPMTPEQVEELQ